MLKKSAFVSAAAAGLMMLGAPAFAGGHGHDGGGDMTWVENETSHYVDVNNDNSLVSVDDVLSNNAIPVCHNNVNVLGVQVADVANGLGLNLPILNNKPASNAEGNSGCAAGVSSVETED